MGFDIGAGLSQMGSTIANQAGAEALNQQKAELENQKEQLVNQLISAREHTGRVESGEIAAKAAGAEHEFQSGQQGERLASEKGLQGERLSTERELEGNRIRSSEKIAGGEQSIRRAALTPEEVRTAQWLTEATPEQRDAFQQANLAKAGVPLWMSGAGGNGAGAGAPAPASKPGKGASNSTPSKFNEAALSSIPPAAANIVKAMVEGRIAPPSGMAMSKPYWQTLVAKATEYDPSFDQTSWSSRTATRKDFTAGQSSKAITALNTALGHAGVVMESFDKLNNFGGMLTPLNAPKNWLESTAGDERPTNTQVAVSALASEARKVFAASGGGNLTELESWEKNFPLNGSPKQQSGAMKQFVNLLDSRLSSLADQYNRGMGKTDDPMELLEPHARAVYEQLTGRQPDNATGYQTGQKPGSAAPEASALPPMEKRVNGKIYQTPTGPHMWMGTGWAAAPSQGTP